MTRPRERRQRTAYNRIRRRTRGLERWATFTRGQVRWARPQGPSAMRWAYVETISRDDEGLRRAMARHAGVLVWAERRGL